MGIQKPLELPKTWWVVELIDGTRKRTNNEAVYHAWLSKIGKPGSTIRKGLGKQ